MPPIDIVDMIMEIMEEPPPIRARRNSVDKLSSKQGGNHDDRMTSHDPVRIAGGHSLVPRMELDQRVTKMELNLPNRDGIGISKNLAATLPIPSSVRFIADCPACRKLKKIVQLQQMCLKPPCKVSEHKRGIEQSRQIKKYPCHREDEDGRRAGSVSGRSPNVSSAQREDMWSDDDDYKKPGEILIDL